MDLKDAQASLAAPERDINPLVQVLATPQSLRELHAPAASDTPWPLRELFQNHDVLARAAKP